MKRALVLGCGGVAGFAWAIPTLYQLSKTLDWDPRDADIIVGTSAGAILASLIGSGVSVEQLMEFQQQGTIAGSSLNWDHNTSWGKNRPPLPKFSFTSLSLVKLGFQKKVTPITAVCGLSPRGTMDMTNLKHLVESFSSKDSWVKHPACWMVAVDNETGKRVAFGAPDAPQASVSDAACASYAIPSWCPPVEISGRTYIDGGVASPTSADFVKDEDVDEVIILAPFSSQQADKPWHPLCMIERRVRRSMTAIVDEEVKILERAGKKVIRLDPGPQDLQAIGYNMMDHKRRLDVFERAKQTSQAAIAAALS